MCPPLLLLIWLGLLLEEAALETLELCRTPSRLGLELWVGCLLFIAPRRRVGGAAMLENKPHPLTHVDHPPSPASSEPYSDTAHGVQK